MVEEMFSLEEFKLEREKKRVKKKWAKLLFATHRVSETDKARARVCDMRCAHYSPRSDVRSQVPEMSDDTC